jgi:DNA modification methylase
MSDDFELFEYHSVGGLTHLPALGTDSVVISTRFDPTGKLQDSPPANCCLNDNSIQLLQESVRALRLGGLLYVYGTPPELPLWGEYLSRLRDENSQMVFKYWIALNIDDAPSAGFLKPTHLGLLMFLKSKSANRSLSPFHLNTSAVRVPHAFCRACRLNVKDWGGKKHLMNPKGTALSDVWRDLSRRPIRDAVVPKDVLSRIHALTKKESGSYLHVVQKNRGVEIKITEPLEPVDTSAITEWQELNSLETNRVYRGDCITFLKKVRSLYPQGIFDLAFADPPYNLKKSYDSYVDALAEQHYIEWCNSWLEGMAQTLKPGGSLIVLNLPKWTIQHAAFLNGRLDFRHWIVWDALSDPRGKVMPAHYAMLYCTRPGAAPVFNYSPLGAPSRAGAVLPPDSPEYCLRAKCLRQRKKSGDNRKVELTDVWFDIHRIKHKRDRDAHPCQLPEKLMERIILLTTQRGGLVFDPFCGAGTTAIVAAKLGRNFVVTDFDPNYVRITNEKLASLRANADLFGSFVVPRQSVRKQKGRASKREVEMYLQQFAQRLGCVPTTEDIESENPDMLRKIDLVYPNRGAALKRCKIVLA